MYDACDALEPLGYGFKKKPDEGKFSRSAVRLLFAWELQLRSALVTARGASALTAYTHSSGPLRRVLRVGGMKGLAFAYDPDGYWVEIVKRGGP